ncbi:809_t:CDS:2 [Entrophospora sp. SA101]|nr:809_t:CDS:2 [Entrophospora sp. SA101]
MFTTKEYIPKPSNVVKHFLGKPDDEDIDSEFHNADIIQIYLKIDIWIIVFLCQENQLGLHKGNIDTSLEVIEILESTVNPNLNNSDDEKMCSDDRMETSETLGFPVATVERTIQVYGKSEASIIAASDIKKSVNESTGLNVSVTTIYRSLHEIGLNS